MMRQVVISFDLPSKHKQGGLASKAEQVRGAGKGGDTMLVHVNDQEFEWMKEHFGEGSVNPDTGLHQFTPFWQQDWFAPVATAAANIFAPGVGSALGSTVGNMFGVTSPAIQAAIGSGLIGGGLGALSGNALQGAALGALTPYALSGLTGAGGALAGLNMMPSAASAAPAAAAVSPTSVGNGMGNIAGVAAPSMMSQIMKAAPLLLAASALGGSKSEEPSRPAIDSSNSNKQGLKQVEYTREQTNPNITEAYAYGPEQSFFKDNKIPTVAASHGTYVKGGGTGTSDSIPAVLSDGEYVMDAQTVSMLGDGSSDAGAKKLDQMRENIRKQKGGALSKGKFAPDAKAPLSYIRGSR
jgi:hypothetical protein